jgi:hypothetical protein
MLLSDLVSVVCSCEHGNETAVLIKIRNCIDALVCRHPKTDCTSRYYTDLVSAATEKFVSGILFWRYKIRVS